jgi:pyruvate formate lyase activating enzyme
VVCPIKEALFYQSLADKIVRCNLCSHRCSRIANSKRGICGVRENQNGKLYSLVYGKIVAQNIDPIEKKPLFHFLPGSLAYSIGTVGCNFRCGNCQNYTLSQSPKEGNLIVGENTSPEEIVAAAKRYDCPSIAYTYSEPTIFFEYAFDTAKLAQKAGIKNVFVTNGYITEEALRLISPYLDAANVDLKSFSESFYRENCGAQLQPVLDSIKLYKALGIWTEITTLVIPTLNDSDEELREIASFIKDLGEETPWHLSRFYPLYRLTGLPPTPISTLQKASEIGKEAGLRYVYQGNVPGQGENTDCHKCGRLLIERYGYEILDSKIEDSKCPSCGTEIDGIWKTK